MIFLCFKTDMFFGIIEDIFDGWFKCYYPVIYTKAFDFTNEFHLKKQSYF
jgi:hypothetical protein